MKIQQTLLLLVAGGVGGVRVAGAHRRDAGVHGGALHAAGRLLLHALHRPRAAGGRAGRRHGRRARYAATCMGDSEV